jgi:MFS family permease
MNDSAASALPQRHASTATTQTKKAAARTLQALDWLNFFLADVQTGVGPFLAIYLAKYGWNEELVGTALAVGGIAGILAQTPAGALVDGSRSKRALVAAGIITLAVGALVIAVLPKVWPVLMAQVLIGASSSIFIPGICAISLGIVGHRLFDRRQGRNQTFNSAGNVVAAVSMGLLAYFVSDRAIFFFVMLLAIPTLWALSRIRADDIDYEVARGASRPNAGADVARVSTLLRNRGLGVFLVCAVLFHFANAAMLPLLGEMLAKGQGRASMMFMSACVVTTQLVITLLASWAGVKAGEWGRKPLLLIGFLVLPIRGILYTLTGSTPLLVGIQVLDGIGAGIFGVVSVLVIADLTQGSGRFNLALGAITTAVGIGASLSQVIAGGLVHHFGYHVGFLFLAAVALAALVILYVWMPETRDLRSAPPAQAPR